MATLRLGTLVVVAWCIAACDPNARASKQQANASKPLSQAYESCAATSQCSAGLRCLDQVCVEAQRSVLGDYHTARGRIALGEGKGSDAIEAITAAIDVYQAEELKPPIELQCLLAQALAIDLVDAEAAERGARSIHQCVLATPSGSSLHRAALQAAAQIAPFGLDPELLARSQLAEKYLTKPATRGNADLVRVALRHNLRRVPKSYQQFADLLTGEEGRKRLVPCWKEHLAATKSETLTVAAQLRYRFQEGVYEADDRYKLRVSNAEGKNKGSTGEQCTIREVAAMAKDYRGPSQGFTTKLSITLRVPSKDDDSGGEQSM